MGRTPDGGPRRSLGLLLVPVLLAARVAAQTLGVPAVPFLPQSEALCGGAAAAMVLRYWGATGVAPEDFAGALTPEGTGIPADVLVRLVGARGFRAFPFRGTRLEVLSHLEKGRPIIALLGSTPGRYHYVVVLAWANQRVLVHDPAIGPHRTIPEHDWQKRWDAAGAWALLVLPPEDFSVPFRERAALEVRQQNWPAAAELAAEAVRRDPSDVFAWKLLATSRFVAGERIEALAAWNRVGEPLLDLVQINGFLRTPAPVAHAYLGEEAGGLLTFERLRRVQRRIDALPATQLSRVAYRPQRGGTAQLEVNVVERPAFSSLRSLAVQSAMRAVSEHAIGVVAFALAPSGDSLGISGQWRSHRSQALLAASAPHFLGLPGIATAEALWDEQSYRTASTSFEGRIHREVRTRGALSLAHWWTADTRIAVTVAGDRWKERGTYFSLAGDLEQRLLGDRMVFGGRAGGWWSPASPPFFAASGRVALRSRVAPDRARVVIDASYEFASARSPLALWPGAGTGSIRPGLLRGRPLAQDGVIESAAFGRQLLNTSVQAEVPLGALGPAPVRAVVFVDAARVFEPATGDTLIDAGVGLRVQLPGWGSALRADLATPWGRLHPQLSVGWQKEWR